MEEEAYFAFLLSNGPEIRNKVCSTGLSFLDVLRSSVWRSAQLSSELTGHRSRNFSHIEPKIGYRHLVALFLGPLYVWSEVHAFVRNLTLHQSESRQAVVVDNKQGTGPAIAKQVPHSDCSATLRCLPKLLQALHDLRAAVDDPTTHPGQLLQGRGQAVVWLTSTVPNEDDISCKFSIE